MDIELNMIEKAFTNLILAMQADERKHEDQFETIYNVFDKLGIQSPLQNYPGELKLDKNSLKKWLDDNSVDYKI